MSAEETISDKGVTLEEIRKARETWNCPRCGGNISYGAAVGFVCFYANNMTRTNPKTGYLEHSCNFRWTQKQETELELLKEIEQEIKSREESLQTKHDSGNITGDFSRGENLGALMELWSLRTKFIERKRREIEAK